MVTAWRTAKFCMVGMSFSFYTPISTVGESQYFCTVFILILLIFKIILSIIIIVISIFIFFND